MRALLHSSVGVAVFTVVNTPSLKLLTGPTPLVNLATVGLLAAAVLLRLLRTRRLRYSRAGLWLFSALALVYLWTVLPELLLIRTSGFAFAYEALRFLYVLIVFFLIVISARKDDVRAFLTLQVFWGVLVAALYLVGLLTYSTTEGQHYNTVTLPIGLASLALIGRLLRGGVVGVTRHLLVFLALGISAVALINLPGRSPYIFAPLILAVYALLQGTSIRERLRGIASVLATVAAVVGGVWALIQYYGISFSNFLMYRLEHLAYRVDSGVRVEIYRTTLHHALEKPFGYGFGTFKEVTGIIYPHNLILEVLFSGGIVSALIVIVAFVTVGVAAVRRLRNVDDADTAPAIFVLAYLFLTFMVSYSLADSYMLFAALALMMPILFPRPLPRPVRGSVQRSKALA